MSMLALWLVVAGMGVVTFALRFSFIALLSRMEMPRLLRRALPLVPAAVLAALIVPAVLYEGGTLDLSLGNERMVAGAVAVLVAWRTRSVVLTIGAGMGVLWLLQTLS
jgi:branched-subunit amino acid transport protein